MSAIPALSYRLTANERLKSRKILDALFDEGKVLINAPFRLIFMATDFDPVHPVKVAFSAPKRRMRMAHDRNLSKRRMREAYRKNKHPLLNWCREEKKGLAVLLISQSNTPLDYSVTEEKIILLLNRLISKNDKAAQ